MRKSVIIFNSLEKKHKIKSEYYISDALICKVDVIRDLGVFLDSKLKFAAHIEHITSAALKSLGFVLRNAREFKKISTVITLFNCFVRSKLEYCSVIWSPHYSVHINRIEKIQKRFVKFMTYHFKILQLYSSY